ncbi:restriction endonuclease subunit S [Rossellomorea marisflavi]|uniref:restriction endonuclease subunit S n=1 Tax=Rossellomorea marisflavi TaxID=189381 RepID=UPI003D2DEEC6
MKVRTVSSIYLKDAIELISGRDLPKTQFNSEGSGIPYIMGASNIKDGVFKIERWTENPTVIGVQGDIILTVKGTVGEFFIQNEEEIHLSRQVMALRVKNGFINEYIKYFLAFYLTKLKEKAKGMIPGISREDILMAELPNFDLEQQNTIIKILKIAESLISKRKVQLRALSELQQSIFIEMFGDPSSNRFNLPKDILNNITNKITDGEHQNPIFESNGFPMVMAKNVLNDEIDLINTAFISEEDLKKFRKKCNPEKDDILVVSRGATIGRASVIKTDVDFALMGSVILIKLNINDINPYFLKSLLNQQYYRNKLLSTSGSSAQQAIYLKDLKKLEILLPDINLQRKFAGVFNDIEEKKKLLEVSLDLLIINYRSLLQRLFKGELN